MDTATGAASGAVGARGGVAKEGLNRAGKAAVTGAQVAIESGIGVAGEAGKAAAGGREFTFDNALHAASQSVWAGVVGEAVSGAADGAAPLGKPRNPNLRQEDVQLNGIEPAKVQDNEASDQRRVDIGSTTPFGGKTKEQLLSEVPPPIAVPETAKVKGLFRNKQGNDHLDITFKVDKEELDFSNGPAPHPNSNRAEIEAYYHTYSDRPDNPNWRINVYVGNGENRTNYVALRPQDNPHGPFALRDLELIPRGPSNPVEVVGAKDAALAGSATPEQIQMLKETWKGMEQIYLKKEQMLEKGLITQEELDRIKDLMERGHFEPGTYQLSKPSI